ncbi:MAG: hypothetical protein ABIS84_00085 [Arachnia sp.]
MIRTRFVAVLTALGCLVLSACAANAFDDIVGEEPVLPVEVQQLSADLHTLRPLGEHGDITYVAAKSRDAGCLVMYRTADPARPIAACSDGDYVTAGGEDVGEATFFFKGRKNPGDEFPGEQVSKWLVINRNG